MVWNCPHCRAALALPDELLGSSWNMSQCPNCENSGFIRRPGNLAIKVDKVPEGEKVLIARSIAKPAPLQQAPKPSPTKAIAAAPGKKPWPTAQIKPIIRPAVKRKPQPVLVPAPPIAVATAPAAAVSTTPVSTILSANSPTVTTTVATKLIPEIPNATLILKPEDATRVVQLKAETEKTIETPRIPVTVAPPEFTREILQDSGLIDKSQLVARNFQIPKLEAMMAVGHSVKGAKKNKKSTPVIETHELPEALPELPELPPPAAGLSGLLSEISAIVPTVAFLVISGIIGWNAVRYVHGNSETSRHEIVDHLSSRAMAPVRSTHATSSALKDVNSEKFNDDPTQVRTRTTEVQAYSGPGVDFRPDGMLQPGHLYSVLEKDGNWIKFALDQTHAAWVSIAGVDLIH